MRQTERATAFRRLHAQRILILPNAWDAASARVIEHAGALAIATTSAGVSWTHGRGDGQKLDRAGMIETVRSIAEAVDVPVTADIEGGYGTGSPQDVAETVRAVLDAGAVGVNLEDSPGRSGGPLLEPGEQAERIRAAREAAQAEGVDLFLNVRTDVYLAAVGEPEERVDAVIRRAAVYLEAGADGIFVPGVTDGETIAAIIMAVDAPINVMAGPGAPSVPELEDMGVARVSLGPAVMLAALGLVHRAAHEVLTGGTYQELEQGLSFGQVNGLFTNGKPR